MSISLSKSWLSSSLAAVTVVVSMITVAHARVHSVSARAVCSHLHGSCMLTCMQCSMCCEPAPHVDFLINFTDDCHVALVVLSWNLNSVEKFVQFNSLNFNKQCLCLVIELCRAFLLLYVTINFQIITYSYVYCASSLT